MLERVDVNAALAALMDIRSELVAIRIILEEASGAGGEQEEEG